MASASRAAGSGAAAMARARKDALCTFKCLDICNEKAPGNAEYCSTTCESYCAGSEKVKTMQKNAREGSFGDRVILNSRKGKFVDNSKFDKKVSFADTILGRSIVPTNETDYKN